MFGYETLRDYEAYCRRVIDEEKGDAKDHHYSSRRRWARAILAIIEGIRRKRRPRNENLS